MTRFIVSLLGLAFLSTFAVGCAMVASPVGNGALYTDVHGPVATGPEAASGKSGKACAANYLGFVAVGNASIEAARKNGGISRISTVDHRSFGVLGIYTQFCTVVSGS